MTICIAAVCESSKTAILVADRRISMEYVEADVGLKIDVVAPQWLVLLAGNDLAAAHEIITVAGRPLHGQAVSSVEVRDTLSEAYQRVRLQRAEAKYLRSRGWTLEEFKQKGRTSLPESTFVSIDSAIARYDLEVDIIACGFSRETGEIVLIGEHGVGSFETPLHFATIGTGATIASAQLFVRKYSMFMNLPQALYCAYEAKVAAEGAAGVSRSTHIIITRHNQPPVFLSEEEQKSLRSIYDQLKAKGLSGDHVLQISSLPQVQQLLAPPGSGALQMPPPHG